MKIVFVCQRGQLEIKSVLLAWSIKKFQKESCTVIAAIPRYKDWGDISSETKRILKALDIECIEFTPSFGDEYPIGNKIDALKLLGNEQPGCFIDTDMMCLNSYCVEDLLGESAVAAKPADMSTWGTEKLWMNVYSYLGMNFPDRRVRLSVSESLSWPYFNAGFIAAAAPLYLAETWMQFAKRLNEKQDLPNKYPWLDQISLPPAIQATFANKWACLDEKYNYPAHLRSLAEHEIVFCHYHNPGVILREPRLRELCNEFLSRFPEYRRVLNSYSDWKVLSESKFPHISTFKETKRNFLITGIPRSGTSYVSTLLHSQDNWVVINEPVEIFEQLKNRKDAGGIAVYHAECREKILSGKSIENKISNGVLIQDTAIEDVRSHYHPKVNGSDFYLGSKNTLAYIAALSYLIRLQWPIVAMVRNPIDTLASWRNSFAHLKEAIPNNLPIANPGYHGWSASQRMSLEEICEQEDERLRRVLLWKLLAASLIEYKEKILLFRYEDVVVKPILIQEKLNKQMDYKSDVQVIGSQYRSRLPDYDSVEKQMLMDLCANEMRELGYTL